jgi:hypothetical protein
MQIILKINPSLANEFATATLRFGHTAVNRLLRRYDSNNNEIGLIPLINTHFQTDEAYK